MVGTAETGGQEIDPGIPGLAGFVEIGVGGFASVYSAHERDAGRQVAVKVLRAADDRARARFDRERRNLGMMTEHPHIVTMFRSGFTDYGDHPYLVMEYMPGGSLQDRLDRNDLPPIEHAIELAVQIADAIGFAHGVGIVHKDIKPANILLSRSGAVKLTDFGISAVRDATGTSQMGFSLAYAPPETFQAIPAADGRFVDRRDERSDLYSLAATLYALIVGTPPFPAETQATAMHRILTDQPRATGLPDLDRFFAIALAKDAANRFPSAAHFSSSLRSVTIDSINGAVLPPTPQRSVSGPAADTVFTSIAAERANDLRQDAVGSPTTRPVTAPDGPPAHVVEYTAAMARRSDRRRKMIGALAGFGLVVALGVAGLLAATGFDPTPGPDIAATPDTAAAPATVDSSDGSQPESGEAEPSATRISVQDAAAPQTTAPSTDDSSAAATTTVVAVEATGGSSSTTTSVAAEPPALADKPNVDAVLSRTSRTNSVVELSGGRFASVDFQAGVRVWDRASPGQDTGVYRGHTGGATAAIALDSGLIASGGSYGNGEVHIWDPNDPSSAIATYTGHQQAVAVTALLQLRNGLVVSGDAAGEVHIWDPTSPGGATATYPGHAAVIITKIIQLESGLVLSNGQGNGAHVWDPTNPRTTRTVYSVPGTGTNETYTSDIVELDGGLIASDSLDGVVHVWSPGRPGSPVATFTGHGDVGALLALPGGLIASGGENGQIYVWDPNDPSATLLTYSGHRGTVSSIIDLNDGTLASTASNEVHLWSPHPGD